LENSHIFHKIAMNKKIFPVGIESQREECGDGLFAACGGQMRVKAAPILRRPGGFAARPSAFRHPFCCRPAHSALPVRQNRNFYCGPAV